MVAFICLSIGNSPPAAKAQSCSNQVFRTGPSAALPDCRAYEQASPSEKGGLDAITLQPLYPAQATACASEEACSLLYMNASAAFGGAPGNELPNAYDASRAPGGWTTLPLSPPLSGPPVNSTPSVSYSASADLSEVVLRVPFQRLTPGAPGGVYNLFLRHPDGSYSLITAVSPPSLPPSTCGSCFVSEDVPAFAGASANFSQVLFEANDALTEAAPGGEVANLYETETATERVRLVGILPDGTVPAEGSTAGGGIKPISQKSSDLEHDISQDGSRVLFQAEADGGAPDPQQEGLTELYDRIGGSETVEISAPAPGATPADPAPQPAAFWAASADGSRVFFTSSAELTTPSDTGSANEGQDLYEYDFGRPPAERLTDLTVDSADSAGAEVLGILGASTDGNYLYFVARGDLAPGATSGLPNLYERRRGSEGPATTTFIATLAEPAEAELTNAEHFVGAFHYQSDLLDWTKHPTLSQAYVTPDGRHLAFMSVNPLTGYNNTDQTTGDPDHEVFSYDAEANHLTCASCDPSGKRPLGSAFIGARLIERVSTPFHQPRTLSDDGARLFFSSPDYLVPGLPAGHVKVYESEDRTIHPISSPLSLSDDVFLDASASGNDVFFASRAPLSPTDEGELTDVYDARVDGGIPPPPAAEAPCAGGACQAPPTSPPSWPTPGSSSYAGSDNASRRADPISRCKRFRSHRRKRRCLANKRRGASSGAHKARSKGRAR